MKQRYFAYQPITDQVIRWFWTKRGAVRWVTKERKTKLGDKTHRYRKMDFLVQIRYIPKGELMQDPVKKSERNTPVKKSLRKVKQKKADRDFKEQKES